MSKTENMKKAQRAASSPAARKKAADTLKRRNKEKKEALALIQPSGTFGDETPVDHAVMSIDDIPDPPKRRYTKKGKRDLSHVKYESGRIVTEDEWLFLQVAKRMLRGVK